MSKIEKLKPRKISKGEPSRYISLDLPKEIEEQVKLIADEYGSIRNVFEVACREFVFQTTPIESKGRWTYMLKLSTDVRKGLKERIPFYGLNESQLIRSCIIRFLERRKK